MQLTKEEVQSLLRIESESECWYGKFDLFVEGLNQNFNVTIELENNSRELNDRTIQTINDVANLTSDHYDEILRLLFDDAMDVIEGTSYGETQTEEVTHTNWIVGLFRPRTRDKFIEFTLDDPRHPFFGLKSQVDIESRIKWDGIWINDSQDTTERVAFLTCYPPWEDEHGREIGICNGVPVGLNQIEFNEYHYLRE